MLQRREVTSSAFWMYVLDPNIVPQVEICAMMVIQQVIPTLQQNSLRELQRAFLAPKVFYYSISKQIDPDALSEILGDIEKRRVLR